MHTLTYFIIDKSGWGRGPWDDEPDVFRWRDEETGMLCITKRNPHYGVWCGYVGVLKTSPLYEVPYEDTVFLGLSPHGGLTFAGKLEDQPETLWFFGFDCGHFPDYAPALAARETKIGWEDFGGVENYRTLEYVREQCALLARQIWQMQADKIAEQIKPTQQSDRNLDELRS